MIVMRFVINSLQINLYLLPREIAASHLSFMCVELNFPFRDQIQALVLVVFFIDREIAPQCVLIRVRR